MRLSTCLVLISLSPIPSLEAQVDSARLSKLLPFGEWGRAGPHSGAFLDMARVVAGAANAESLRAGAGSTIPPGGVFFVPIEAGEAIKLHRASVPRYDPHWRARLIAYVDGTVLRLGGFAEPEAARASALADALRIPGDAQENRRVAELLAMVLDPNGAYGICFETDDSESCARVLEEQRRRSPEDWSQPYRDDTARREGRISLTVLSKVQESVTAWEALRYTFDFDSGGRLTAWGSQRAEPFQVHDGVAPFGGSGMGLPG